MPAEMLAESKQLRIVTNIPINKQAMGEFVAARSGQSVEDVTDRIMVFGSDLEERWSKDVTQGGETPAETFAEVGFDNTHFILDEAHHFCGRHHSKQHRARWMGFVGELRKRGGSITFITQSIKKLPQEIECDGQILYELITAKTRRDPIFNICVEDWCELIAKLRGKWLSWVWLLESTKRAEKWVVEQQTVFALEQKYFELYQSYNRPIGGGAAVAEVPKQEWERRTWTQLIGWFCFRNFESLSLRLTGFALVVWLTCFGGGPFVMQKAFAAFKAYGAAKREEGLAKIRNGKKPPTVRTESEFNRGAVVLPELDPARLPPHGLPNQLPIPEPVIPTVIVGMVPGGIVDEFGFVWKDGDELDGKKLSEIDYAAGRYRHDGRLCRLGHAKAARAIRGPVPTRGAAPLAGQNGSATGQAPDVPVSGSHGDGSVSVPSAGDGQNNRGSLGAGQPASHNRSNGRDALRGSRSPLSPVGRAGSGAGQRRVPGRVATGG